MTSQQIEKSGDYFVAIEKHAENCLSTKFIYFSQVWQKSKQQILSTKSAKIFTIPSTGILADSIGDEASKSFVVGLFSQQEILATEPNNFPVFGRSTSST